MTVHDVSLVDKPAGPLPALGTKEEIDAYLWNVLRSSTEVRRIEIPCEKCPGFKHEVEVTIAGGKDGMAAAKELLDRMEGKPSAQKPKAEVPRFNPNSLDELTDEQLDAIIAAAGVSTDDD